MRLQRRRFLEIDQSETRMPVATMFVNETGMCDLYRGTSIYASYQVSVQLAKRCKRRRFLEIDQSETRIACGGHFVNG
jgi:hypothetical protein